jgi:hypothetical protein
MEWGWGWPSPNNWLKLIVKIIAVSVIGQGIRNSIWLPAGVENNQPDRIIDNYL